MFNYKRTKKPNSRYSSEEYMPRIIEKMYNLGGSFSYEQDYPKKNYSLKINKWSPVNSIMLDIELHL